MKSPINNLPEIGYLFHYPTFDQPTGHFQLDVYVSSIPTEKHFDVQFATFSVKTSNDCIRSLTVTQPWNFEKNAEVCAGPIVLEDRKGKKVEAFSFGGRLNIESKELQTVCTLVSDAPILDISIASPMNKLFIEEVEIILAKSRADYPEHLEFEKKLCAADPFILYMACLNELIPHIADLSQKQEPYNHLENYLHTQIHRFESAGLLKSHQKDLECIFKTP